MRGSGSARQRLEEADLRGHVGRRASLLLTDQTANGCLSILLPDHAGEDRDRAWRPEARGR